MRLDPGPRPLPGWGRGAIAAYLGSSEAFDDAVATFAVTYADVNDHDHDHRMLAAAVEAGRLKAVNDL